MRGKPRMQDIYCTLITTRMLEDYRYKDLYMSPVKNVGYENSLVNKLRKHAPFYSYSCTWREKQIG